MATSRPRRRSPRRPRLPVGPTIVLGLVPLVAFGGWFYGYGVLLEPIRLDTGWSASTLSTVYGLGLFLAGIGAGVAGQVLDRRGSRPLFLVAATVSAGGHLAVVTARDQTVFAVAAVVTGGVVGAAGYYAVVHAVLARLTPDRSADAITINTLWGAFASPVFLPLLAWLVTDVGWRPSLTVVGVLTTAVFLAAAALPDVHGPLVGQRLRWRAAWELTGRVPAVRRLLLVGLASGTAASILVLEQVPAMASAGLALTTASSLAGARGVLQLGGRIPLPWVIRAIGSRRALRIALAGTGVGCLLLTRAGSLSVALTFVVVAGLAIGALAALESIVTAEASEAAVVGTTLGLYSLTRGLGSFLGPTLAGVVVATSGGPGPALVVAAVAAGVAALLVPGGGPPIAGRPART